MSTHTQAAPAAAVHSTPPNYADQHQDALAAGDRVESLHARRPGRVTLTYPDGSACVCWDDGTPQEAGLGHERMPRELLVKVGSAEATPAALHLDAITCSSSGLRKASLWPEFLEKRARAVAEKVGFALPEGSVDPGMIASQIAALPRECARDCLAWGRGLIVLLRKAAKKFPQWTESSDLIKAIGGYGKLTELIVLSDEQADELAATGKTVLDDGFVLTVEDIAGMTVKQLRKVLDKMRGRGHECRSRSHLVKGVGGVTGPEVDVEQMEIRELPGEDRAAEAGSAVLRSNSTPSHTAPLAPETPSRRPPPARDAREMVEREAYCQALFTLLHRYADDEIVDDLCNYLEGVLDTLSARRPKSALAQAWAELFARFYVEGGV